MIITNSCGKPIPSGVGWIASLSNCFVVKFYIIEESYLIDAPKLTDEAIIFTADTTKNINAMVFKFKNTDNLNKVMEYMLASGEISDTDFEKYVKVMEGNIK